MELSNNPASWPSQVFDKILDTESHNTEVIMGIGEISTKKCVFWATDRKINQSCISKDGFAVILLAINMAHQRRLPLIAFLASTGVDVKQGVHMSGNFALVLKRLSEASLNIPTCAVITGINLGASSYLATMMDFIFLNRIRSHLCISSPTLVKDILYQDSSFEKLGGCKMHEHETGIAQFACDSITDQINKVRKLINFFPSESNTYPEVVPAREPALKECTIPLKPSIPFDMSSLIDTIVDENSALVYNANFGTSAICCWARVGGFPAAIVANQSLFNFGALDTKSCQKIAAFVKKSDRFNIPILTLIDCPGMMPGEKEEQLGILHHGAKLITEMNASTQKLVIIVRKCYGAAAIALCPPKNSEADWIAALKGARCAPMGFRAAKNLLYKDSHVSTELLEQKYYAEVEAPTNSLRDGIIDEIIDQNEIRTKIIQKLSHNPNL